MLALSLCKYYIKANIFYTEDLYNSNAKGNKKSVRIIGYRIVKILVHYTKETYI